MVKALAPMLMEARSKGNGRRANLGMPFHSVQIDLKVADIKREGFSAVPAIPRLNWGITFQWFVEAAISMSENPTDLAGTMAKAPTHGPVEPSMSGNGRIMMSGMESSTAPMEQFREPIQTVNGFPNNRPGIAEITEIFTVLVGCW